MKIKEVTQKLGTTNTSIARWITEFSDLFSEGAKLRNREFNENDLDMLATIAALSRQGLNYPAVRDKISAGYKETFSTANFGVDTLMVPAAAVEQMIDASAIRSELEIVKAERDRLLDVVSNQADTISAKDERIDQLQSKLLELTERAARAEATLEAMEKQNKRRWFGG